MKTLSKYIGATVIKYIVGVMILLSALQAFLEFTREFANIGTGFYGLLQVLLYVPMVLPINVYQFFPIAGLLGCIVGLGLLSAHSELTVMRACGVSMFEIGVSVAKASFFLVIIILFFGEVLAPAAQRKAVKNKTAAMSRGQAISTYHGIWIRGGNEFIHIDTIDNLSNLNGVTRYVFGDDNTLRFVSFAEKGVYQNKKWIFTNISQTVFVNGAPHVENLDSQQWKISLNPRIIGVVGVDTDQKPLWQLYSYIKSRKQSGLNTKMYECVFWQRVFFPLSSLLMIMLAIPFVFGPLRSSTTGFKMVIGVLLGFGFYLCNQFVGSASAVYQVPAALAAALPSLLLIMIGFGIVFVCHWKNKV